MRIAGGIALALIVLKALQVWLRSIRWADDLSCYAVHRKFASADVIRHPRAAGLKPDRRYIGRDQQARADRMHARTQNVAPRRG